MSVTGGLYERFDKPEIHWITRKDMASILRTDPHIKRVWDFDRKKGLRGLIRMAREMKKENYDFIYDAHLNIRSYTVRLVINSFIQHFFSKKTELVIRKKYRINRFLFFRLGKKDAIPQPFRGMISFQKPLRKYGIDFKQNINKEWIFPDSVKNSVAELLRSEGVSIDNKTITIIPSAAWELKRWPLEHWKKLVKIMPDYRFIVLAGPDDVFTREISEIAPERVLNLAGRTNLNESFYLVHISTFIVSADTGFLHAADLFARDGIAFMGPTAFGHTTGETIKVMEIELPCRPCSKEGNSECKIAETKKCLFDITPVQVKNEIVKTLKR